MLLNFKGSEGFAWSEALALLCSHFLILLLMEYPFGLMRKLRKHLSFYIVLILVLMEYPFGPIELSYYPEDGSQVLILVLMEYPFGLIHTNNMD